MKQITLELNCTLCGTSQKIVFPDRDDFSLDYVENVAGLMTGDHPLFEKPFPATCETCKQSGGVTSNIVSSDSSEDVSDKDDHADVLYQERLILHHLASAWNRFTELKAQHNDDASEFRSAIHRAQTMIGARQAQRAHPEMWGESDNNRGLL